MREPESDRDTEWDGEWAMGSHRARLPYRPLRLGKRRHLLTVSEEKWIETSGDPKGDVCMDSCFCSFSLRAD